MAYTIPEGSVEIQTGLWLYSYNKTISGVEYTFRQLYAAEGYCFYNTNNDSYDEDGNLQRIYARYAAVAKNSDLSEYHSVLIEDGMNIVNDDTNSPVTA